MDPIALASVRAGDDPSHWMVWSDWLDDAGMGNLAALARAALASCAAEDAFAGADANSPDRQAIRAAHRAALGEVHRTRKALSPAEVRTAVGVYEDSRRFGCGAARGKNQLAARVARRIGYGWPFRALRDQPAGKTLPRR